ncbi:hypothetical protein F4815DRAFT_337438 [Daldinia loculata]|nr:hypothetical protein F4815DRAFT_337438 [Daldinia loculata]
MCYSPLWSSTTSSAAIRNYLLFVIWTVQPVIYTFRFNLTRLFTISQYETLPLEVRYAHDMENWTSQGESAAAPSLGLADLDERRVRRQCWNAIAFCPSCGKWRIRRFVFDTFLVISLPFLGLAHSYDTPSVFWIRCHSRASTKDSPATVLLRHRLGRRVAAEAGPTTMLLRYRLGTRLVGIAYTRFFEYLESSS